MPDGRARAGVTLVALLWLALALNYLDRQMVYSIFPALQRDLGFTPAELGLIGGIFGWVYALCMPFAGRLADRSPRHRLIVASMALWSAATLGCALSGSVPVFLAWRAAMAVTESLYFPAAVRMIAGVHAGPTRSRALGVHQSAQLAGLVAGGWYGGWAADNLGWRTGFGIAAAGGFVYAAALAGRLRKVVAQTAEPEAAVEQTATGRLAELLRSPRYLALNGAFFSFCAMLWVFYAWFPNFLLERYSLSMTASGFNATVYVQSANGAGILAGGWLADRLAARVRGARFYVAAAGVALSAPFAYLTFASSELWQAKLYSGCFGAMAGLLMANIFAAAYDAIAPRNYGLGAGVLNMVGGIAGAIMIYLWGLLKNTVGLAGLMAWAVAASIAAALVLAAVAGRSREPGEARSGQIR